jgi:polysaccharide chain length determinant protein (PEP-CTERM system associated)
MANRELSFDDYMAMLRRRAKVILIPALLAPLAGWLVSYAFPPKYTSQSLVLVEGQKVPEGMVQPVVTQDLMARVATLEQQVLSQTRLQPMIERLQLIKPGQNVDDVIEKIRLNTSVQPVPDLDPTAKKKPGQNSVPGFYVNYVDSNPREAQQLCNELTSLMLEENLKSRQSAVQGTTDFLSKGLQDAKTSLDAMDAKLAAFKKQYVGQLPGDEENNLKILMGLNSQLESNTQQMNRAQQDKAYTESLLAQQLSTWKSSQTSSNPATLEKQLADMQSQLLQLQARYTPDHPDVIKTKADISEVKKKLDEINKASAQAPDSSNEKASASEPPEIRQLRLQVHQYGDLLTAATRDQKRLQQEISVYQGRIALSPAVEEQYKQLSRDYENAQKNYTDLLADKSKSDLAVKMEQQLQGEFMHLLNPASVPDSPSFPNRPLFAGGGLGAGLILGLGLGLWLEFRDQSIRTQADAEAALDLPLLVAVPWVGEDADTDTNGGGRFWKKKPDDHKEKEKVGV